MYDAFDRFLNHDLWRKDQGSEKDFFYDALVEVVHEPGFDSDRMRDYFTTKKGLTAFKHLSEMEQEQEAGFDVKRMELVIMDDLAGRAQAVQEFLAASKRQRLREFEADNA